MAFVKNKAFSGQTPRQWSFSLGVGLLYDGPAPLAGVLVGNVPLLCFGGFFLREKSEKHQIYSRNSSPYK